MGCINFPRRKTEEELRADEEEMDEDRNNPDDYHAKCTGFGCEECFFLGLPDKYFREWRKRMSKVSRAQLARAATVFHMWAIGDKELLYRSADQLAVDFNVPLFLLCPECGFENLIGYWVEVFHGLYYVGEYNPKDGNKEAGEACAIIASIYLSEANR
jgi:hypothetical protein